MLVFDPLAVALVIAVNFLLKNKSGNIIEHNNIEDVIKEIKVPAEPYKVYIPDSTTVEETITPVPFIGNDPQFYLRGDFDWSKRHLWEGYPPAVKYYEERIKQRLG